MKDCRATWHLVQEQRKHEGRPEMEWEGPAAFDRELDLRKREEKELWYFTMNKWTQDLKSKRILMAQEDGLGLML